MEQQISGHRTEVPPADAVQRDLASTRIQRGTRLFRGTVLALSATGFSTFALVFSVQALLPLFSQEFNVSPAESSLAVSATTLCLAFSMLVASSISEIVGRKLVMVVSLLTAAALTAACAVVQDWHQLVILRALAGLAFGGLPAVVMAYISEEISPAAAGLAMGLVISGNGLGGMSGRVIMGIVADTASWRSGLIALGFMGILSGLLMWWKLAPSRHFQRTAPSVTALAQSFAGHLRNGRLVALYLLSFLMQGAFICVYNYIGYRLTEPPFSLSHTLVGFIFAIYLVGIVSAPVIGDLSGRLGRVPMLALCLTLMLLGSVVMLASSIPAIIIGMCVVTFGFFGGHSVASSWVGVNAIHARAQASSIYLFSFYVGSSVIGTLGGVFWSDFGWPGVTGLIGGLVLVALLVTLWLHRVGPAPAVTPVSPPAAS